MSKSILEIHEDVPANHYDKGIKNNSFQRYWHTRRFQEVLKVIKPINGPVLDIGCHGGTFTEKILTKIKSKKIYGIDVSITAISLIKERIPFGIFQVTDASNLPFQDNFFKVVFCLEVLEHVDYPIKVLSEVRRVLTKTGHCFILIPTNNLLFSTIWFLWTLYYSVWRHTHVQSFHNQRLEKLLKKLGFKIVHSKTFNLGMLKLIIVEKAN